MKKTGEAMGILTPWRHPRNACLRPLVAVQKAPVHVHAVADPDPIERILIEDGVAAVAHPHGDAVAFAFTATFFDLVAGDRAADGARGRRDVVAPAAANLVAEHAAHDAA